VPTQAGNALIKYLEGLFEEGTAAKDDTGIRRADSNVRFQRGDQWPRNLPAGFPDFTLNLVQDVIQRKAALLTDSRPQLQVISSNEEITKRPDVLTTLEKVLRAVWDQVTWSEELARGLAFSEVVGCNIGMMSWDPLADGGRGDIRPSFFDPRYFVCDPAVIAATDLQQGEFCATEEIRSKASLIEQFGEIAQDAKPDGDLSSYAARNRQQGVHSPVGTNRQFRRRSVERVSSMIPRVKSRNYYFKDFKRDERGKPIFYENLHPARRVIRHAVVAGGEVLVDEPNPHWHAEFPYEMLDWGLELDNPYGASEVQNLRRAQETLNKIASQIIRNTILTNNIKVVGDSNALDPEQWDRLTNRPALILRKRQGTTIDFQAPPALPGYLFQLIQFLIKAIEMVSGLGEVTRGTASPSQSGIAVESLAVACVDSETECLTQRGWKHHWELIDDDVLYTMNPATQQGEWSPLLALNLQENYDGPMWYLRSKSIDACVTPTHDWVVDTYRKPGCFAKVHTDALNVGHRIPTGVALADEGAASTIYSDSFVELVGWVVTEGWYATHITIKKNGKRYTHPQVGICQSLTANPENCERITSCLERCGIPYHTGIDKRSNVKRWYLGLAMSRRFIEMFPDKRPGYDFINMLACKQLRILAETMLFGDGTSYGFENPSTLHSTVYGSADKELADQFQMIIALAGIASSVKPDKHNGRFFAGRHKDARYGDSLKVTCHRVPHVSLRGMCNDKQIRSEMYNGTIWCPTTVHGNFLARRNGRTFFTGNSQTLIRFQARRLEAWLTRLWTKAIALVFQHYGAKRVMRIVGAGGRIETFLWDRAALFAGLISPDELFTDFALHIAPGSSLAVAKIQKATLAMQLHKAGILPGVEVLRAADWRDPEILYEQAQKEAAEHQPPAGARGGRGGRAIGGRQRVPASFPASGPVAVNQ